VLVPVVGVVVIVRVLDLGMYVLPPVAGG